MSPFSFAVPALFVHFPSRTFLLLFFMATVVPGCGVSAARSGEASYPAVYEQRTGTSLPDLSDQQIKLREQFAELIALYQSLEVDDVTDQARSVYAEDLYFNDTLKTFTHRAELIDYLKETAARVEFNHVDITSIIPFRDDYFLRWKMSSGFKVMGRMIEAESIGMTHIRLDDQGKVNFHQDFWDNTQGLFQHLPVVGFIVRKTRDRL